MPHPQVPIVHQGQGHRLQDSVPKAADELPVMTENPMSVQLQFLQACFLYVTLTGKSKKSSKVLLLIGEAAL